METLIKRDFMEVVNRGKEIACEWVPDMFDIFYFDNYNKYGDYHCVGVEIYYNKEFIGNPNLTIVGHQYDECLLKGLGEFKMLDEFIIRIFRNNINYFKELFDKE